MGNIFFDIKLGKTRGNINESTDLVVSEKCEAATKCLFLADSLFRVCVYAVNSRISDTDSIEADIEAVSELATDLTSTANQFLEDIDKRRAELEEVIAGIKSV
jgi:hypothetical protein